jgi:hypothetical protein
MAATKFLGRTLNLERPHGNHPGDVKVLELESSQDLAMTEDGKKPKRL